jgi:hypothetical protein
MSDPSRGRPKWISPTILIVVLITVLTIYFIWSTPGIIKPNEVTLTGTVTTTGTLTTPEKITFTCERSENTFVASVSGGNPGTYTITLPNGNSYKVSITWKFLGATGGNADAGTLNLDTFETSIVQNWAG